MIQMTSDEAFEEVKEACNFAGSHIFYSFEATRIKRLEKALEIMEKVFELYKNRFGEK